MKAESIAAGLGCAIRVCLALRSGKTRSRMLPQSQKVGRFVRICAQAALLLPVLAIAQQAPAGTEISIRLKSAVSNRSSKPADPVEAVVIAPVEAN